MEIVWLVGLGDFEEILRGHEVMVIIVEVAQVASFVTKDRLFELRGE